jgi:hypothetical protein
MTFKLQEFISSINTDGLARTSVYEVIISPPVSLQLDAGVQKMMTLRCQDVQLPELDFQVLQYYTKTIGPGERRVMGLNPYKIIPMELIIDKGLKIRQFFENWMQYIVNYDSPSAYASIKGGQLPYEMSYKEEYVGTVDIRVWPNGMQTGEDTDPPIVYQLQNAYPVNMGNVGLNWNNTDRAMILPIGFTYDTIKLPKMLPNYNSAQ